MAVPRHVPISGTCDARRDVIAMLHELTERRRRDGHEVKRSSD
jgi:hypothetical protein